MIYIDGLTDGDMVQQHVIHPLQLRYRMAVETDIWSAFFYSEIDMADLREEPSFDKMVLAGQSLFPVRSFRSGVLRSLKQKR